MILSRPPRIGALNAGVSVPRDQIHRADPKPEVLSAICGQSISFLPSAYRGARVISTDTLHIFLVLEVSSREQEREYGGEDCPNVEAHREEPLAPGHWELRLAAQTRLHGWKFCLPPANLSSFEEILCADISECYCFQWAFALVSACA